MKTFYSILILLIVVFCSCNNTSKSSANLNNIPDEALIDDFNSFDSTAFINTIYKEITPYSPTHKCVDCYDSTITIVVQYHDSLFMYKSRGVYAQDLFLHKNNGDYLK